jgi:glucosamine--fructose-6-phosphate aminotransferase (isomerizing)
VVAARQIGRRVAAVIPTSVQAVADRASRVLSLAEGVREMFSTVISTIPGSLFAAYRADVIGEPFFRNLAGGRSTEGGGGISRIRTSEVLDPKQWPDRETGN